MSLRDSKKEPSPCWTRAENVTFLRIELDSGEIHLLPYIQISHGHLLRTNDLHTLDIHFDDHTLHIKGHSLLPLLLAVQKNSLESVKASPTPITKAADKVHIQLLQVKKSIPTPLET
jgi:hypothetical protein